MKAFGTSDRTNVI